MNRLIRTPENGRERGIDLPSTRGLRGYGAARDVVESDRFAALGQCPHHRGQIFGILKTVRTARQSSDLERRVSEIPTGDVYVPSSGQQPPGGSTTDQTGTAEDQRSGQGRSRSIPPSR
jgi:hypothetical protein